MLFQDFGFGELAMGGWGNQGKGTGGPKGDGAMDLHMNKNSKNPSKQSFDGFLLGKCTMYVHMYICI